MTGSSPLKIALDAMGGDLRAKAAVEGGVLGGARFRHRNRSWSATATVVAKELAEHDISGLASEIEHAPEVVPMDDSPLESILVKPAFVAPCRASSWSSDGEADGIGQRGKFRRDDGAGDR